jgi:thiol-disulfide isomerase/thioredoxin
MPGHARALLYGVTAGLIVCAAALAVATAAGFTWRQRNGRIRPVAASRAIKIAAGGTAAAGAGTAAAGAGTAARGAAAAGLNLNPAAGLAGAAGLTAGGEAAASLDPDTGRADITGAELGSALGPRATLLQFSTAFCAPCRATRRLLAEVAGMTDGVAHVEIDAESHLDLVRRLDVRRTPTVFVLGPDGRVVRRASGQPRKADLIAALGEVI